MKKALLFALIALLLGCSKKPEISIESADAAYNRFELEEARNILNTIVSTDSIDANIKSEALQRLALQDWKYYQNYESAKQKLLKADSIVSNKFEINILFSRIAREAQDLDVSLYLAQDAKERAQTTQEKALANTALAHTGYEIILKRLNSTSHVDSSATEAFIEVLSETLKTNAGMPVPSKLLLGTALLNRDGANVLKAWLSYFHIQSIEETYPYLQEAAQQLKDVCSQWQGQSLNIQQQEQLIKALGNSRFYEFIPVYVKAHGQVQDYGSKTKDILAYANFLERVKSKTDEYYRLIAIGKANEKQYKDWLSEEKQALWKQLSFAKQAYSTEVFNKTTETHFGTRGFDGGTASYQGFNLCLGHIVNQKHATVEQYGYQPKFLFTEIDMMTSNTFPSWYWEDMASGGWATEDEVIQVREVYLSRPFAEWYTIADSVSRNEIETFNAEFLAYHKDEDMLLQAKGLEKKLNFDASKNLYQKLFDRGLRDETLRLAFLSTFRQYRMEATILAHEGRHSIEKRFLAEDFKNWDNEVREFHAKLSQIIFATEPRYELAGMVNNTSESGHGKANQRIVDIAVKWIQEHKSEIAGFSENKSAFSQIYLMSTEQIKSCYLAADPLNR